MFYYVNIAGLAIQCVKSHTSNNMLKIKSLLIWTFGDGVELPDSLQPVSSNTHITGSYKRSETPTWVYLLREDEFLAGYWIYSVTYYVHV